jgi:hypothetical protein
MDRKIARLAQSEIEVPPAHDWRTTDTDEINKRRLRARAESLRVTEMGGAHPIFANFQVSSGSGLSYSMKSEACAHAFTSALAWISASMDWELASM